MTGLSSPAPAVEYPVAFGQWSVLGDALVCRLPRRTVQVNAPQDLLTRVLQLCDGHLHWQAVAAELAQHWDTGSVEAFLSDLCSQGALVEAGEALAHWAEMGQVPGLHVPLADEKELPRLPAFAHARLLPGRGQSAITPSSQALEQLLALRESVRAFADEPITSAQLASIAWAAHGVTRRALSPSVRWHRTIASGGNMHSMRWFAFVLRHLAGDGQAQGLDPGLYEARFHLEGGASFERQPGAWQDAWRLLGDPRLLQFASALLVPVHDVAVPARKYGNRATIFGHIEAGQSLQNAQLMAGALGVSAIVRGDTGAKPARATLAAALRASEGSARANWLVMPALAVGAAPDPAAARASHSAHWFRIGRGSLPRAVQARQAFAFSVTSLEDPKVVGLGRSADPALAMRKAEAEAWERFGWRTLGPHVRGVAADLPGALDPELFCAYSQRQLAGDGLGLQRFSPRRKYLWRAGVEVETGRTVHLPAECLHPWAALPAWARRQACANATTSGVAAWPEAEGALMRATLELLERDAFLRSWLSGSAAPLVCLETLPSAARQRIADLQQAGFRVAVAAIGAGWVPVYSVFVQNAVRPLTAIMAAADFSAEAALAKALDEAEGRASHVLDAREPRPRRASELRTPMDIHRYYQSPRFFRKSDFHADADPSLRFQDTHSGACKDWKGLRARLAREGHALYAFDLTPAEAAIDQGRTRLHVMRAMVTGLIPIWFQYGSAPTALPAFRQAAARVKRGGPASLVHPFT
jgi:ribosomal protein S12 methylthiotransferase accessory factor